VGRLESGETFAIVERRMAPFFYAEPRTTNQARALAAAGRPGTSFAPSRMVTMDGAELVRIECPNTASVQALRDAVHVAGVRTYEADLRLSTQYLVDRHIHGTAASRASGEQAAGWAGSTRIQRFHPRSLEPLLSVLSLDIETDPRADTVYAVGLAFQDRGR